MDNLRKELNVQDLDPNALGPSGTLSQEQLTTLNIQRIQGEKEYVSMEKEVALLHSLQATNPAMLRDVLPGIAQDSALSDVLSRLNQTRQSLAALQVDYGTNNPDVLRQQKLTAELNQQIDDRVTGIMAGLDTKVQSLKASLDAFTASCD